MHLGLVQRGHDPVLAEGLVGECGRLQGRHARVLVNDPALIEGADDGAEAFDDGGGEVGLRGRRVRGSGQSVGIAVVGICLRGGDSPVAGTDQRREALTLLRRRPPVDAQLVAGRVDVDLLGGQLLPGLTQHRHEERSGAQEPPDADRRRVERRVGAALDDHPGEHRQRGGQHEHEHEAHDEAGHLGEPPQETARRPTDALRALRLRPGHGQRTL